MEIIMAYRENAKILKADCLADGVYEILYVSKSFSRKKFLCVTDSYYMLYSGRNGSNGVYKGKDGYIINTPVKCDEEKLNANITAINNFVKNTGI